MQNKSILAQLLANQAPEQPSPLSAAMAAPGSYLRPNNWTAMIDSLRGSPSGQRFSADGRAVDVMNGLYRAGEIPNLDFANMPASNNIEDRRNEQFSPLRAFKANIDDLLGVDLSELIPGRRFGPYDQDIDESLRRFVAQQKIEPQLKELKRRENWFAEADRQQAGAAGPPVPSDITQELDRMRRAPGLMERGNINLGNRPVVRNPDGSISTVRSISVNFDGHEVLIPTVSDDGRILDEESAIEQYRRTGRHLGIFDTPENATSYAKRLHEEQARQYLTPTWLMK